MAAILLAPPLEGVAVDNVVVVVVDAVQVVNGTVEWVGWENVG